MRRYRIRRPTGPPNLLAGLILLLVIISLLVFALTYSK